MTAFVPEEVSSIQIQMQIIEGRDLIAKDRSLMGRRTTSDPYVKIFLGGKCYGHNTEVIEKNLNPKWDAKFKILLMDDKQLKHVLNHDFPIRLVVWDKDLAIDDCMGVVDIPVENIAMDEPKWFPLEKGEDVVFDEKEFKQYCHNAKGDIKLQYTIKIKTKENFFG